VKPESCRLIDDGGPQVISIEDPSDLGHAPQALWFRVGPVYDSGKLRTEPGVWVCYQKSYLAGPLDGPVLLTPAAWEQLVTAVNERLTRCDALTVTSKLWRVVRVGCARCKIKCAEMMMRRTKNGAAEE
jgi:hypothetical protein